MLSSKWCTAGVVFCTALSLLSDISMAQYPTKVPPGQPNGQLPPNPRQQPVRPQVPSSPSGSTQPALGQQSQAPHRSTPSARAFGADVVVAGGSEGFLQRLGLEGGSESRWASWSTFTLSMQLRVAANPQELNPAGINNSIPPAAFMMPQFLLPYVSNRITHQPVSIPRFSVSGTLLSWRGNNEFEIRDTIARFMREAVPRYQQLAPPLPITVAHVRAIDLGAYDSNARAFPIDARWSNGGLIENETFQSVLNILPPYQMDRVAMEPEAARRLRERAQQVASTQTNIVEMRRLWLVERYKITSLVYQNRTVVANTTATSVQLFDPRDLQAPLLDLPLPDTASQNATAPSAAPRTAGNFGDPEWPILMMVKADPQLVNDAGFLASAFALRRAIEATNMNCSPTGRRCIPTNTGPYLPAEIVRTTLQPNDAQLRSFGASLVERSGQLPETVLLMSNNAPNLARPSTPAQMLGAGTSDRAAIQAVQTLMPDAQGFSMIENSMATRAERLPITALAVHRLSEAWTAAQIDDPANTMVEYQIHRTAFGNRPTQSSQRTFLVELEPIALHVRQGTSWTRVGLTVDSQSRRTAARDANRPETPWEVLGARLGMPFDEAVTALRANYGSAGTARQELTITNQATGGGPQCDALRQRVVDRAIQLEHSTHGLRQISAEERRIIRTQVDAEMAPEFERERCPHVEDALLVPAFAMVVTHPRGITEQILLYRNGSRTGGAPILTVILRSFFGSALGNDYFDAAVARYGNPTVPITAAPPSAYWLESSQRRGLFPARNQTQNTQCHVFWPAGSSNSIPNIPSVYAERDCGALLRFDQNRLMVLDSHWLSAASRANNARRQALPAPPPAAIRF